MACCLAISIPLLDLNCLTGSAKIHVFFFFVFDYKVLQLVLHLITHFGRPNGQPGIRRCFGLWTIGPPNALLEAEAGSFAGTYLGWVRISFRNTVQNPGIVIPLERPTNVMVSAMVQKFVHQYVCEFCYVLLGLDNFGEKSWSKTLAGSWGRC